MIFKYKFLALCLSTCVFVGCKDKPAEETSVVATPPAEVSSDPAVLNYVVVNTYPHDTTAFTEGLLMHEGALFESTGSPEDMRHTRSLAGPVDLKTGKIDKKVEIDRNKYFGEGVVFLNGKLYQLTYITKVGFIYDAKTYKKLGEFTFPSQEGWGMTTDGTSLIMSDGTNILTYLDPVTFKTVKTVSVTGVSGPVTNINELEYINGFIYANVYTTNIIIKIDPNTGKVVGTMDLSSLDQDAHRLNQNSLELNGIAYDSTTKNMYVTGKFWPTIYELKFAQ